MCKQTLSNLVLALVLIAVAILPFPTATAQAAAPTATCSLSWTFAPLLQSARNPAIRDIKRVSPKITWAVGTFTRGKYRKNMTATWDGQAWTQIPTPGIRGQDNLLDEIAALAPNDIWAVGTSLLHWNGKKWSIVPAPTPAHNLKAFGTNDLWLVNIQGAHHWDGATWSTVTPPTLPNVGDQLTDMVVSAANDIWALGFGGENGRTVYIGHWDGTAWTLETTAINGGPDFGDWYGAYQLLVVSPTEMWASGGYSSSVGDASGILERDGAVWNFLPLAGSVHAPTGTTHLTGSDPNYLWAIAYAVPYVYRVLHRDNTGWHDLYIPRPYLNNLTGVFVASPDEVWVLGRDEEQGDFIYHNALPCETAPGKTKPIAPRNDTHVTKPSINLTWKPVADALYYQYEIRRDAPDGVVALTLETRYTGGQFGFESPPASVYYWRVRACKNFKCSKWTRSLRFYHDE